MGMGMTMKKTREQMIRLAYAKPELRSQLLPRIKKARWGTGSQYIPDDSVSLGFTGPDKEAQSAAVGAALEDAYHNIRLISHHSFKKVATVLRKMDADTRPDLSRAAIGLAYQDVFLNLADSSLQYFRRLPKKTIK